VDFSWPEYVLTDLDVEERWRVDRDHPGTPWTWTSILS
jgi:hypothetical protein